MNTPKTRAALAIALAAMFTAVPSARAVVLADLLTPGAGIWVGSLYFSDFSYTVLAGGPPANEIDVNAHLGPPFPPGPATFGLSIEGAFIAFSGSTVDVELVYKVTSYALPFENIFNKAVFSSFGSGTYSANITQTVTGASTSGKSVLALDSTGLLDREDPPDEGGDLSYFSPVDYELSVTTDIRLSADANSLVAATTQYQGFTIPEPSATCLVTAIGLISLGLYRRFVRR